MATFYLDAEGGNDANDGTTFANRWKTLTNGATAARIAPGDTIRIMASPDPTSMGSATWTGGGRPAAVNIASSTNATPIVITTSAAHGLSAGDYVCIVSHTTNTNANGVWKVGTVSSTTAFQILQMDGSNTTGNGTGGASGTSTKVTNCIVKVASPLTKNVALCGGLNEKPAWTASTNVTTTQSTNPYKEGYSCADISIAAAFTTGKAAYYTLPSTLDLSTYQQLSFWVRFLTLGTGYTGDAYIALCSDTTGDTVVDQFTIPSTVGTGAWMPIVSNKGANLGSSIKSVALYIVTDVGAQRLYIDNIIACKAASSNDSVNLTSLISKSDGTGTEAWYPIQSINYDAIMLGNGNSSLSTAAQVRGYNGTTATTTTYKRETIKISPISSPATDSSTINDSGTSGSPIVFSGGWNRTDMSTQTGVTWWDGQNGYGMGISSSKSYINFEKLNMCRFYNNYQFTDATYTQLDNIRCSGGDNRNIQVSGCNNLSSINSIWLTNASGINIDFTGSQTSIVCGVNLATVYSDNGGSQLISTNNVSGPIKIDTLTGGNSNTSAVNLSSSSNILISTYTCTNAGTYAVQLGGSYNISINGGSSTGSLTGGVLASTSAILNLNNFTINETTEVALVNTSGGGVYSSRHDNTDNNSWIWQLFGTINQQTSVVDSPATTAWKMSPTNSSNSALAPVKLKLATIVVAASSLVTITARMRRDNTGLTMRLIAPANGMTLSTDAYTDMTAAANTWETVTLTFTPTRAGGVDIYAYAFGGTTYNGYVCNITASQA